MSVFPQGGWKVGILPKLCVSAGLKYSIHIAQLTALTPNRIIPVVCACVFVVVGFWVLFLFLTVRISSVKLGSNHSEAPVKTVKTEE